MTTSNSNLDYSTNHRLVSVFHQYLFRTPDAVAAYALRPRDQLTRGLRWEGSRKAGTHRAVHKYIGITGYTSLTVFLVTDYVGTEKKSSNSYTRINVLRQELTRIDLDQKVDWGNHTRLGIPTNYEAPLPGISENLEFMDLCIFLATTSSSFHPEIAQFRAHMCDVYRDIVGAQNG